MTNKLNFFTTLFRISKIISTLLFQLAAPLFIIKYQPNTKIFYESIFSSYSLFFEVSSVGCITPPGATRQPKLNYHRKAAGCPTPPDFVAKKFVADSVIL